MIYEERKMSEDKKSQNPETKSNPSQTPQTPATPTNTTPTIPLLNIPPLQPVYNPVPLNTAETKPENPVPGLMISRTEEPVKKKTKEFATPIVQKLNVLFKNNDFSNYDKKTKKIILKDSSIGIDPINKTGSLPPDKITDENIKILVQCMLELHENNPITIKGVSEDTVKKAEAEYKKQFVAKFPSQTPSIKTDFPKPAAPEQNLEQTKEQDQTNNSTQTSTSLKPKL